MKQIVGHEKISPLKGALLVLVILALFFALSVLLYYAEVLTGRKFGMLIYWPVGALIAGWILFRFIRAFEYDADEFDVKINRLYGKRRRLMADVILRNVRFAGDLAEAKKAFPHRREYRATHKSCAYPRLTVAYDTDGNTRLLTLQPEPRLRDALIAAAKTRRSK